MSDTDKSPAVQEWLSIISEYESRFKKWETRVEKIIGIFRDDQRDNAETTSRFNVLQSIVKTISPAVFSRLPKAEVSRRHRDTDPIGRVACLILERVLDYEITENPDYREALTLVVEDRFLGGRGTAWVRYEPHIVSQALPDGAQVTEDVDEDGIESLENEKSVVDYVHWKDFGHGIARTWEEVPCVWRKVYMTRKALIERFGKDKGNKVPFVEKRDDNSEKESSVDQGEIYEVWDKSTKKVYWICKSMGEVVDERDDPLGLKDFFPCPKPLYSLVTSDSLIPIPDFLSYQDQASELNELAERQSGLIKALKVRGVCDASVSELVRLFGEANENELIPVQNWAAFSEKQGLRGTVDIVDLTPIVLALGETYKVSEQLKNQIYELTGVSDIIRGSTNPNETAEAQKIKGQYVSVRLGAMQSKVNQFAQDLIKIKAQLISQHYSVETLRRVAETEQMTFEQPETIEAALQMLTSDPLLKFRVEVAADSMLQVDDDKEKRDRLEFLESAGSFMEKAGQAVAGEPLLIPLVMDMLRFGFGAFKAGRTLEGRFDQVASQMEEAAKRPKPEQPNPDMIKAQTEQQKIQADLQMKQGELAQESEASQQRLMMENNRDTTAMQLKAETDRMKITSQETMAAQQQAHELLLKEKELAFERWRVQYETNAKVSIADQQAETTVSTALVAAESKQDDDPDVKDE